MIEVEALPVQDDDGRPLLVASVVGAERRTGFRAVATIAQPGQLWETLPGLARLHGYRRVTVADLLWVRLGPDRTGRPNQIHGRARLVPCPDWSALVGRRTIGSTRRLHPRDGRVPGYRLVSDPNQYRVALRPVGGGRPVQVSECGDLEDARLTRDAWVGMAGEDPSFDRLAILIERQPVST